MSKNTYEYKSTINNIKLLHKKNRFDNCRVSFQYYYSITEAMNIIDSDSHLIGKGITEDFNNGYDFQVK